MDLNQPATHFSPFLSASQSVTVHRPSTPWTVLIFFKLVSSMIVCLLLPPIPHAASSSASSSSSSASSSATIGAPPGTLKFRFGRGGPLGAIRLRGVRG